MRVVGHSFEVVHPGDWGSACPHGPAWPARVLAGDGQLASPDHVRVGVLGIVADEDMVGLSRLEVVVCSDCERRVVDGEGEWCSL